MKTVVVVQASQVKIGWRDRFFKEFDNGENVIDTLLSRLMKSNLFTVVLATSTMKEDDILYDVAKKNNITCVRGEQEDVVQRLIKVANVVQCDSFIRVSGYSPLVDIEKLEEMYAAHIEGAFDYSYNEHQNGVPMGMGGDVFSVSTLEKIEMMKLDVFQKEFVGLFIRQNESIFKVNRVGCISIGGEKCKLTIERQKDFEVVNELIKQLGDDLSTDRVSSYLEQHSVLRNYNKENPPREAGVEKLMLNEDKVNALLKRIVPDDSYPISVELTLTNACNLNCVYCSDMALRNKQGFDNLGVDVLKMLFDDLASGGTKGVVLEGGGEPTIYPMFSEIVEYAKSVGLAVGLITNGTQSIKEKVLKELEWIRVSLDASTREEYLELKGRDKFETVLSNIATYVKNCSTVGVGYVVTNKNISQIESLVLRLRMIGVSYIQLRPVVDNPNLYPTELELDYLKYYQMKSFGVDVGGMVENAEKGNRGLSCYAHSLTSIISGDGSVYICGRLNVYDWLRPIGNIKEQRFKDIWLGEERKKQAKLVSDAKFCIRYCPQCRITKFNEVIEKLKAVKTKNFI